MFWSAVLRRRLALSTATNFAGALEQGFQIHCSSLLKHSSSSVVSRQTLKCKAPLCIFSTANFSFSSSKPYSHVNLLRITDDEIKCGVHDQEMADVIKQEGGGLEFCCTVHKDDIVNDKATIRKNKKKIIFIEEPSFRQEEDGKVKQKEEGKGERLYLLKSRGQHLLTNPRVLDSIIRKAKVLANDTVLEIGPGTGNLTVRLLECARKVIAVEIDDRMVHTLLNRVSKLGLADKLVVIKGNVLKMELPRFDLCVSNIPYGISSPLIAKIFLSSYMPCFRGATLLLQKEFARRLLAKPGESDFNRLAVNVGLVASVDFLMNVSKKDFVPSPKVDSSLVQIQPKLNIPDINLDEWLGFTRTCFSQRNKTLCAIFKQKKKIMELYERSQLNSIRCKNVEYEGGISNYDIDGNDESDNGEMGTSSLELKGEDSTKVLWFKEKIMRILKDGDFGDKRTSKLSNEEFLCLLHSFNKEGVFFH